MVVSLSACSSSEHRSLTKADPFGDPSKFESLASNAYSLPMGDPVVAAAPALDTKPILTLDGASLVSPALAFTPDLTNRVPASALAGVAAADGSTPESAYANLIRGNERFVTGTVKGEHRDESRRREVASLQKPFAVVLSCSDSRVPPELIFDQGLGDLFTIRVAGNVLGSAQVASIEYAVEHLGAKLILVLGHESCGAVKAALEAPAKAKVGVGSPDLDWLVGAIRPVLKARGLASVSSEDPHLRKPVMANIDSVTENLVVRSKIIGDAVAKGNLKVVRGIYSLDSGRVDFWGMK